MDSHRLINANEAKSDLTDIMVINSNEDMLTKELITLDTLKEMNPWLNHLDNYIQIPKTHHELGKEFVIVTVVNVAFAVMSVVVYWDGSKPDGLGKQIGGVSVNFTQNVMFGYLAANELATLFKEKKYVTASLYLLGGIVTTVPTAINEYVFSDKNMENTIFTFVGNLPLNSVGIPLGVRCIHNYLFNRADALKEFYLQRLEEATQPSLVLHKIFRKYSDFTNLSAKTLRMIMSGACASALVGSYVPLNSKFLYDEFFHNVALSVCLGFAINSPSILISIFMTGDVAYNIVHGVADFFDYFYQKIKNNIDTGLFSINKYALKFAIPSLVLNGVLSYEAFYSNASASNAYENNMPEEFKNLFWFITVMYGTIAFNLINSCLAVHKEGFKKAEIAYCPPGIERDKFIVEKYKGFLESATKIDLQKLTQAIQADTSLHLEDKLEMKPPVETKSSLWQSVVSFFHCGKNRGEVIDDELGDEQWLRP